MTYQICVKLYISTVIATDFDHLALLCLKLLELVPVCMIDRSLLLEQPTFHFLLSDSELIAVVLFIEDHSTQRLSLLEHLTDVLTYL